MNETSNTPNRDTRKRVVKHPVTENFMALGRIPPQAIEFEEAVIGAIMLERSALHTVSELLSPDIFYKEANQRIVQVIIDLIKNAEPVDLLTVAEALKKNGELELVGGPYYLTQLTNRIAGGANVEHHTRIIIQKFILRELIRISSEIQKDAYDDSIDVFELLDKAQNLLFEVSEGNVRRGHDKMQSLIAKAIEQIEIARTKPDGLSGVPSGFSELDRLTSGWQNSDLIVLAARPGMGKTAFVLSMARNIAVDYKRPVAFFSLEMSSLQLITRLISSETELEADKLKKGSLADYEWHQLHSKIGKLADAPLFIDDTPSLTLFELKSKCRRLKSQFDIQIIFIDYLQLMVGSGDAKGNREQEISNISRSLKSMAKELNVPVIALSQLSRAVESRGGAKKPILSDLRESGAIEQDADMVVFIYRPEYYKMLEDEKGNSTIGMAEIIVAKHRNGALKDVPLRFIDRFAKFADPDIGSQDYKSIEPHRDFDKQAPQATTTFQSKINDDDKDQWNPDALPSGDEPNF